MKNEEIRAKYFLNIWASGVFHFVAPRGLCIWACGKEGTLDKLDELKQSAIDEINKFIENEVEGFLAENLCQRNQ